MGDNRTKRVDRKGRVIKERYKLNANRKKELIFFCRQYPDWISLKEKILKEKSSSVIRPSKELYSDPTGTMASILADVSKPIKLVENTAKLLDPEFRYYILLSVTEDIPYKSLVYRYGVKFSKDDFDYWLAKFYWLLSIKKGY